MKTLYGKIVLPDGYEDYEVSSVSIRKNTYFMKQPVVDYKRLPIKILNVQIGDLDSGFTMITFPNDKMD